MSADNCLVSVSARQGRIALYEVSCSDARIRLDAPRHEVCPAVIAHALAFHGLFESEAALQQAVAGIHATQVVEYPPVFLHTPPQPLAPPPFADGTAVLC